MALKPVEVVDGLVAGIITAAYNFVGLTALTLAIPFVRNTKRFWPRLIAMEKKLSSLTFMALSVIWAILSFSNVETSTLVSVAAGTAKGTDSWIIVATVAGILVSVVLDLLIRGLSAAFLSGSRRRKELYQSLLRLSVGTLFTVATITNIAGLYETSFWFGYSGDELTAFTWQLVFLSGFTLPIFVVLVKALGARKPLDVVLLGIAAVSLPVVLLANLTLSVYFALLSSGLLPGTGQSANIESYRTTCDKAADGSILVTTFLRLSGEMSRPVLPDLMDVYYQEGTYPEESPVLVASGAPGQPPIVLSEGEYAPVRFAAQPVSGVRVPEAGSDEWSTCGLRMREEGSSAVIWNKRG